MVGRIVKYVGAEDTLAFEREKNYKILEERHGFYRIMTELDEDYWFPVSLFELI